MEINEQNILIREYDYGLPAEKIAGFPLPVRDQSRLLVYKNENIIDEHFYNLHSYLPANSTVILNDTRVIEARILFTKPTGGIIEIFCLEPYQEQVEITMGFPSPVQWKCLIGGASKWKPGQLLKKTINTDSPETVLIARYIAREQDHFIIEFSWLPAHLTFGEILHAAGDIPLPPYIRRKPSSYDAERYQTVFNQKQGSVAAPTSALHFTDNVFKGLSDKNIDVAYITLHIGAGTFKPVKSETIAGHHMHSEPFTANLQTLQKIQYANEVIAVGTTTMRTLESLYWIGVKLMHDENSGTGLGQWEAYELAKKYPGISVEQSIGYLISRMEKNNTNLIQCDTSMIIVPGYVFKIPKALVTNFHQPQSTLLLLVSAFIGNNWKKVYSHALENDYRFLSYGDSSLLWRND